ncbi:MAG: hypothetical protein H6822_26825 [Planctomycetaceae bacterium]|nr:hypothetical protein [Planctomycetales bacterium]MCB9925793.1 hypothetical protein [Planctomycetaceae bacterium]
MTFTSSSIPSRSQCRRGLAKPTVWRSLFVEVDSFGVPQAGTNYNLDPTQPVDDPEPGDIPDPPTAGLIDAL